MLVNWEILPESDTYKVQMEVIIKITNVGSDDIFYKFLIGTIYMEYVYFLL